jgi:carbonic anhydrase
VAGAKAILVLGHTKCGAVKGACDGVELGNLTSLLQKIRTAVDMEHATTDNRTSSNAAFVERVAQLNLDNVQREILDGSPLLAEMVANGEIAIVGAMYDVDSGSVRFSESAALAGSTAA